MKKRPTISEALGWLKTLKARHAELVQLRNINSAEVEVDYQGKTTTRTPSYDAKELDKRIAVLAREIRICDTAIKTTNGQTEVKDYVMDDDVLAELV